jgi:hypothetical protein
LPFPCIGLLGFIRSSLFPKKGFNLPFATIKFPSLQYFFKDTPFALKPLTFNTFLSLGTLSLTMPGRTGDI